MEAPAVVEAAAASEAPGEVTIFEILRARPEAIYEATVASEGRSRTLL